MSEQQPHWSDGEFENHQPVIATYKITGPLVTKYRKVLAEHFIKLGNKPLPSYPVTEQEIYILCYQGNNKLILTPDQLPDKDKVDDIKLLPENINPQQFREYLLHHGSPEEDPFLASDLPAAA